MLSEVYTLGTVHKRRPQSGEWVVQSGHFVNKRGVFRIGRLHILGQKLRIFRN